MFSKTIVLFRSLLGVALLFLTSCVACQKEASKPFVVVFCLDGATPEVIDQLRSENKLPTFERLIRSGTYGRLLSYGAKKLMEDNPRRGYYSPVVWSTIATGKIPERHGIRDFILPIRGTSAVWMGSEEDPGRAELALPEFTGPGPHTLHVRLHSYPANGEQAVQLLLNDQSLDTLRVPKEWKNFIVRLPDEALRNGTNRLTFVFSRQTRPSDLGESKDQRRLACRLAHVNIIDAQGETVVSFDPVYERFSLIRGFYKPWGNMTEVQSVHLRAQPIWSLLGRMGHPVGVIGYWGTWPAYEVNGFLVTSRMGIAEKRQSPRLTWPSSLAEELAPMAPRAPDLADAFDRLHVSECEPPIIDKRSVLKKILLQDEFYFRISKKLLPTMSNGLFSVYFRAIDVGSHISLHWRHGADIPEGCSESIRGIVDEIYIQLDRYLGELLELLPENATVVVISDHGMRPLDNAGYHAPHGILLARGEGIRRDASIYGASVLDIAPTLFHLFSTPIPFDMDGKVLPQLFDHGWLSSHPPRYVEMDTSRSTEEKALTEGRDEILEELRALGYIQ